ncbi:MAG: SCO family protein, partial [Anaerolineae bacterium]|nr:SCO family protein [Anaerolineae bacterium]
RMVLAVVTLAAILLLFGLVIFRAVEATAGAASTTQDLTATTGAVHYLSAPRLLSDFTLTDNENQPLSLSDLEGRYTLLFFGYLHCPDFCPTTLANMRQVYTALGEDADRLNILFISVDGERDTPEALDAYLSRFDPAFIGMQGQRTVLAQITPDYALSYSLGVPDENGDYLVSHSVQVYLI